MTRRQVVLDALRKSALTVVFGVGILALGRGMPFVPAAPATDGSPALSAELPAASPPSSLFTINGVPLHAEERATTDCRRCLSDMAARGKGGEARVLAGESASGIGNYAIWTEGGATEEGLDEFHVALAECSGDNTGRVLHYWANATEMSAAATTVPGGVIPRPPGTRRTVDLDATDWVLAVDEALRPSAALVAMTEVMAAEGWSIAEDGRPDGTQDVRVLVKGAKYCLLSTQVEAGEGALLTLCRK